MIKTKSARFTPRAEVRRSVIASHSCKLFYPFNEGVGDVFTEAVSGGYFTADSVNHSNVANAPQIYKSAGALTNGKFIDIPYGKKVMIFRCIKVNGAYSQTTITVGSGLSQSLPVEIGDIAFDNDSGVGAFFYNTSIVEVERDATWHLDEEEPLEVRNISGTTWDSVTKELRNFSGRAGNGVALTVVGPVHADGSDTPVTSLIEGVERDWRFGDSIQIGFSPFPQAMYSLFMYVVDDLPSDSEIITGLDWIDDAHSRGHKSLYTGWNDL